MARLLVSFVASLVLVTGCRGSPATETSVVSATKSAIVTGTPSEGDPSVVSFGLPPGCTGTVTSARLVVTAAHCVGTRPGDVLFSSGRRVPVTYAVAHPGFDRVTLEHDIAVLVLGEDVEPELRSPLFDGPLEGLEGTELRIVGFGDTDPTTNAPIHGTPKMAGVAVLDRVEAQKLVVKAAPSLPCLGDSGGPALLRIDDVDFLAGVLSSGDAACIDHGTYVRIDAYRSWLDERTAEAEPRSRATGERCVHAESCVEGSCLAPSDVPARPYCSRSCDADAACPAPMTCSGGRCLHPLPSPGANESTCTEDADCESGLCAGRGADGAGRCLVRCAEGVIRCGSAGRCERDARHADAWACFPSSAPTTPGCSTTRAPSDAYFAAEAPFAALAVFLLSLRRRRARASAQ